VAQTEGAVADGDSRRTLDRHRAAWEAKGAVRAVYLDYHRRLVAACPEGRILEIGGGSGHLAETAGDAVSIDIVPSPWVDAAADAHALPFAGDSFDGIVMLDVLHHLERPALFFQEAARVLRPGGRLAMIEPGITPASWLFYKLLHEEPVEMGADPFGPDEPDPMRDPFDSNQAIPTLLFKRQEHRIAFFERCPDFTVTRCAWLSLFAYPLSGGFQPWTLLPGALADPLISLEDALMPFLGPLTAFRLFTVLEKKPSHG